MNSNKSFRSLIRSPFVILSLVTLFIGFIVLRILVQHDTLSLVAVPIFWLFTIVSILSLLIGKEFLKRK
jgi:hypothetical protein